MKKYIVVLCLVLVLISLSLHFDDNLLSVIVEHRLKKVGLIQTQTIVTKKAQAITLKNIKFYLPINNQELVEIYIPKMIVRFSLSAILENRLESILIPKLRLNVPFYFLKTNKKGRVNTAIDYSGIDKLRPKKSFIVNEVAINIYDVKHHVSGTVIGAFNLHAIANENAINIKSHWSIAPLSYKNKFIIHDAKLDLNGKVYPKLKTMQFETKGVIHKAKLRTFLVKSLNFKSHIHLSDINEKVTISLMLNQLILDLKHWRNNPLMIHGNLIYDEKMTGNLSFNDKFKYLSGDIQFKQGDYTINASSVDFFKKPVLLSKLFPITQLSSQLIKGQLTLKGHGRISDWPKTALDIYFNHIETTSPKVAIKNLNGHFNVSQIQPLQINKGLLTIDKLKSTLPLSSIKLNYAINQYDSAMKFYLNKMTAGFSGGNISLDNQVYNLMQPENRLQVNLNKIQLSQLFKIIKIDGLSGVCDVGGYLNFNIEPAQIRILSGQLHKQSHACQVSYLPSKRPSHLASNEKVASVIKYLKNFEIKTLTADLSSYQDKTRIKMHLYGRNPQLYGGVPLQLNLMVFGPLHAIISSIFIGGDSIRKVIDMKATSTD